MKVMRSCAGSVLGKFASSFEIEAIECIENSEVNLSTKITEVDSDEWREIIMKQSVDKHR